MHKPNTQACPPKQVTAGRLPGKSLTVQAVGSLWRASRPLLRGQKHKCSREASTRNIWQDRFPLWLLLQAGTLASSSQAQASFKATLEGPHRLNESLHKPKTLCSIIPPHAIGTALPAHRPFTQIAQTSLRAILVGEHNNHICLLSSVRNSTLNGQAHYTKQCFPHQTSR